MEFSDSFTAATKIAKYSFFRHYYLEKEKYCKKIKYSEKITNAKLFMLSILLKIDDFCFYDCIHIVKDQYFPKNKTIFPRNTKLLMSYLVFLYTNKWEIIIRDV